MNYDEIYAMFEEIVAEKGDNYVYTTDPDTIEVRAENGTGEQACYYSNLRGEPGCIVGHLVHRINPELPLSELEGFGGVGAVRYAGVDVPYTSAQEKLIRFVQGFQDSGRPWGEALLMAKTQADKYDADNSDDIPNL